MNRETEPTPEMIEAGLDEFFKNCSDGVELTGSIGAREMVSRIIGAALSQENQMATQDVLFKVMTSDGQTFRIFKSGAIEGFPSGSVVFNHIPRYVNAVVSRALSSPHVDDKAKRA